MLVMRISTFVGRPLPKFNSRVQVPPPLSSDIYNIMKCTMLLPTHGIVQWLPPGSTRLV